MGDANLRANMAIVAQGLIVKTGDGKTKGDYLLVELSIKNQYIVSDNAQRAMLLAKVNELIPESKAKQIPILFTTLGNGNVGLLPHIEKPFIKLTPEERGEPLTFDIERFRQYLIRREQGTATQITQTIDAETHQKPHLSDSEYLQRVYDLEFNLKPSDSQKDDSALSDSEGQSGESEPLSGESKPLSDKVSGFVWTVRGFGQMYPGMTPEQLFLALSEAARLGQKPRDIIRSILKCGKKTTTQLAFIHVMKRRCSSG